MKPANVVTKKFEKLGLHHIPHIIDLGASFSITDGEENFSDNYGVFVTPIYFNHDILIDNEDKSIRERLVMSELYTLGRTIQHLVAINVGDVEGFRSKRKEDIE